MSPELARNNAAALASREPLPVGDGYPHPLPRAAREQAGARSGLIVALHPRTGKAWLLGLHQCRRSRSWSQADLELFAAISAHVAGALSTLLMNRKLVTTRLELRRLSKQLITAQEEERRLLALRLHDEVSQDALGIKIALDNARLDRNREDSASLDRLSGTAGRMVERLRMIQRTLYPPQLDDIGVKAALGTYVRDLEKLGHGQTITLKVGGAERGLPRELRVVVYRVAQEALFNVVRHAGGTHADLHLFADGSHLRLVVEDDGRGFAAEELQAKARSGGGIGLISMRERTEMSGGTFEIRSVPGRGTILRATWPLPEDAPPVK